MKIKIPISPSFLFIFLFSFVAKGMHSPSRFDPIIYDGRFIESRIDEPNFILKEDFDALCKKRKEIRTAYNECFKAMGVSFFISEPDSTREIHYLTKINEAHDDIDNVSHNHDLKKKFIIYTNQPHINDASVIFFLENHTDAPSKLKTFGLIKQMMTENDVVLLEGTELIEDRNKWQSALQIFARTLAATREFNRRNVPYTPSILADIDKQLYQYPLAQYAPLLNFQDSWLDKNTTGWDCLGTINADDARNVNMVNSIETIFDLFPQTKRIFLIAGGLHNPHYSFAFYRFYIASRHYFIFCQFTHFFANAFFGWEVEDYMVKIVWKRFFSPAKMALDDDFYENIPNPSNIIYQAMKELKYAVIMPRSIFKTNHPDFSQGLKMETFLPKGSNVQ